MNGHVLAMWIYFLLMPSKAEPDPDGRFSLGEIGGAPEKNWTRSTPHSPAQIELSGVKIDNGCRTIAFVNDLRQVEAPKFWSKSLLPDMPGPEDFE